MRRLGFSQQLFLHVFEDLSSLIMLLKYPHYYNGYLMNNSSIIFLIIMIIIMSEIVSKVGPNLIVWTIILNQKTR